MAAACCGACGTRAGRRCRDPQARDSYCASCWQQWLSALKLPAASGEAVVQPHGQTHAESTADDALAEEEPQEEPADELEGRMVDETLYLVNTRTGVAYHSERNPQTEELVPAGVVVEGRLILPQAKTTALALPWPATEEDHCETPLLAYTHLAPLLRALANELGKRPDALRIYDPYFCAGATARHLAGLGFPSVHNACRDCYADWAQGALPDYDVLVTNPPFSTTPVDHIARLCAFLQSSGKPFCVVQPNFVYRKDAWQALCERGAPAATAPFPFYLTPQQPRQYVYEAPPGFRQVKGKQRKTAPFVTLWYCRMPAAHQGALLRWLAEAQGRGEVALRLTCDSRFLPDNFKDSGDKSRRKPKKTKKKSPGKDAGGGVGVQPGRG
jgi:hypothetical protein